jgi:ferredoxin
MVKDEDVCLHCGLCAERCPTGAWDMQKFLIELTRAGRGCRSAHKETPGRQQPQAAVLRQAFDRPQDGQTSSLSPKFPYSPSGGRTPEDGGRRGPCEKAA